MAFRENAYTLLQELFSQHSNYTDIMETESIQETEGFFRQGTISSLYCFYYLLKIFVLTALLISIQEVSQEELGTSDSIQEDGTVWDNLQEEFSNQVKEEIQEDINMTSIQEESSEAQPDYTSEDDNMDVDVVSL